MGAQHTPGPWRLKCERVTSRPMQIFSDAGDVTRWGAFSRPATPEALANARLIAAAPEMLEALRDVRAYLAGFMNVHPHGNGPIVALAAADAAIAKATGEAAP